jgi:hypothetical protein
MPRCLPEVNVSLRNAVQRRFGKHYAARAKEVRVVLPAVVVVQRQRQQTAFAAPVLAAA